MAPPFAQQLSILQGASFPHLQESLSEGCNMCQQIYILLILFALLTDCDVFGGTKEL